VLERSKRDFRPDRLDTRQPAMLRAITSVTKVTKTNPFEGDGDNRRASKLPFLAAILS
jgi:hypothetical protein